MSDLRSFKEQSERNKDDSLIKDESKNVTPKSVESPERLFRPSLIPYTVVTFRKYFIGLK